MKSICRFNSCQSLIRLSITQARSTGISTQMQLNVTFLGIKNTHKYSFRYKNTIKLVVLAIWKKLISLQVIFCKVMLDKWHCWHWKVRLTWWASRSITITLTISGCLSLINLIVRVISAYTQNPPPLLLEQWWKPPPKLIAQPRCKAISPA